MLPHRLIQISFYSIFILFLTNCQDPDTGISLGIPYQIEVTGNNYEWIIKYPGQDGKLNTSDDIIQSRNISLPEKTLTQILLRSDDYIYFFELPQLQQIASAIPDKNYFIELTTPNSGTFEIKGNQMCSYTHKSLFGQLNILTQRQFTNWHHKNEP